MKLSKLFYKARNLSQQVSHTGCAAVIVAAGSAARMKGIDKIVSDLCGMPVICRTLEAFDHAPQVDEIVVVVRRDLMERVSELCAAYPKVRIVVPGGETRLDSVIAGVEAVSENVKLIAIHDGARPLVSDDVIARTLLKADKFGAAAPALPVKDTIRVAGPDGSLSTPDRKTLYAVQTPQAFDADLIRGALYNAKKQHLSVTDDCSCVEAMGMKVQLTQGNEENIKITTPFDLELAKAFLNRRQAE